MKKRTALMAMIAVLAFGLPAAARAERVLPAGRTFGDITIRHFAAGKKVIPAVCEIVDWKISDIKLPDIVVENRGSAPVILRSIEARGKNGPDIVVSSRLRPQELDASIAQSAAAFNKKACTPGMRLAWGDISIPEGELAQTREIKTGESAVLLLSRLAFLHSAGRAEIESLELAVQLDAGTEARTFLYPVDLTPYESKGQYVFPLKGDLRIAFVPFSYVHHRASQAQEFAFDVVGANQDGAEFTEISVPGPKTLSDYSIWGREIYAIGEGTVVETGDAFPEDLMSDPEKFNAPGYVSNVIIDLIGKIGFVNAVAGNYIIIDHHNGEFSAYCHLKEGSLKVKTGDRVEKGRAIARVGNTGNSSAPHLHFQLMDSRDFLTANGLPVMFENAPASLIVIEYGVKANTLSFSDSLYVTIE